MAFKRYAGLTSSLEILEKMRDFALENGWTILENLTPQTSVDGTETPNDGVLLSITDPNKNVFAHFRNAVGRKIFEEQMYTRVGDINTGGKEPDRLDGETDEAYKVRVAVFNQSVAAQHTAYGIGLVCSDSYTSRPPSGFWYDQPGAPKGNGGEDRTENIVGVGVCLPKSRTSWILYANVIKSPSHMLVFSFTDDDRTFQHLACGRLEKVGNWDGGTIFTGSQTSYNMFRSHKVSQDINNSTIESGSLPIFATNQEANTFLRIDVDNAPNRDPEVLWASAGLKSSKRTFTGKLMDISLRYPNVGNANVPNYDKIIATNGSLDAGKDVNTLNLISVNLNLVCYILRDPDELQNYSPVGYVPGVYYCSLKNIQSAECYEISYPTSGQLHQVFPWSSRYGIYGLNGYSVKQ